MVAIKSGDRETVRMDIEAVCLKTNLQIIVIVSLKNRHTSHSVSFSVTFAFDFAPEPLERIICVGVRLVYVRGFSVL